MDTPDIDQRKGANFFVWADEKLRKPSMRGHQQQNANCPLPGALRGALLTFNPFEELRSVMLNHLIAYNHLRTKAMYIQFQPWYFSLTHMLASAFKSVFCQSGKCLKYP